MREVPGSIPGAGRTLLMAPTLLGFGSDLMILDILFIDCGEFIDFHRISSIFSILSNFSILTFLTFTFSHSSFLGLSPHSSFYDFSHTPHFSFIASTHPSVHHSFSGGSFGDFGDSS